jgi:hypothetical protein
MTLKSSQECACRMLDEYRGDTSRKVRPLVILASDEDAHDVRKIVNGSMPLGAECLGATWRHEDELVAVHRFSDPVPDYPEGFLLAVCNGGHAYSDGDLESVRRWRGAAKDVLLG